MYSQISHPLFLHLERSFTLVVTETQELSHGLKTWYYCEQLDQSFLVVDCFAAQTQSYFVQDINA